ncbi:hypothetical protein TL16_g02702 [Triparma laevis f. inornata]|uniref:Ion transport domain-containing protein n=1 Tax=Triparma laevis f. inornata TaxID=1714386 RepID=A0A9W6ZXD2_9STRA|nr:hypothetical protein TL16_g02702 [Triparma laevis f. inornata]
MPEAGEFKCCEAKGSFVLAGNTDGKIHSCNMVSNEVKIFEVCEAAIETMALGESVMYAGTSDGKVFAINLASGKVEATYPGHEKKVNGIAVSHNGKTLITTSEDGTALVWDLTSAGEATIRIWKGSKTTENATCWNVTKTLPTGALCLSESPCAKYLALGAPTEGKIRIWDVELGAEVRVINDIKADFRGMSYLAGEKIVTASEDGDIISFSGASKGKDSITFKGHLEGARSLSITPDGKTLVSGGLDNKVIVWNARTGELKLTLDGHTGWVYSVAVTKDGTSVISGSMDGTARIWKIKDGKGEEQKKVEFGDTVKSVAFQPNENSYFVGGENNLIKQYIMETGKEVKVFKGHTHWVNSIKVSSNGSRLVSASEDTSVIVWDIESGDKIRSLEGHSNAANTVDISPNNKMIVSGSDDNTTKLWSMDNGELLHTFEGHTLWSSSVAIHPSGELLATGSRDKTWKLWSLKTKKLLYTSRDKHSDYVSSVVFSPDGGSLISASNDKTINVEDLDPHINRLPKSLHECIFKSDCKLHANSPDDFDWSNSGTAAFLQNSPRTLIEPRLDDGSRQNLVHLAAYEGEAAFLSQVLIPEIDETAEQEKQQQLAFFALLAKDKNHKAPLTLALESNDGPAVRAILVCLQLLFAQKHAMPFSKKADQQEEHPTELFDMKDLCTALDKFPTFALDFVTNLSLVSSGDSRVLKGVEKCELGHTNRRVTGSAQRVPHNYWAEKLKDNKIDGDLGSPVTALFVPLPSAATADSLFFEAVVNAAKRTGKLKVFENEVLQAIVDHKWGSYAHRWFYWHVMLDFTLVATLTLDAMIYRTLTYDPPGSLLLKALGRVPMFLTILLWAFFTRLEFKQMKKARSFWAHITEFWNTVDAISLVSICAAYVCKVIEWCTGATSLYWSTSFMAIALPATYLNILYYMQGFDGHGPLVRIIIGCVKGVRAPGIIFTICIAGFAASFFILFEGRGESTHATPSTSFLFTYTVMLGGFGVDDIHGSENTYVTATLLVMFTIFTYIVMLNVLISVLSDDFDRIQENGKAEFTFARAETILEFETMLNEDDRSNPELFPTWLQVLVPTLESDNADEFEWAGRVRELKNSVKQVQRKLEESEEARRAEAREIKRQNEERKAEATEMKRQNACLEKMLDQISRQLSVQER